MENTGGGRISAREGWSRQAVGRIAASVLACVLVAAASADARPLGLGGGVAALEEVPAVTLDAPDLGRLAEEDVVRAGAGLAPRYAVPHAVSLRPESSGRWERTADAGTRIWRLRVRAPGALSLNFGFSQFRIPAGAVLHVYAANGTSSFRGFTADDVEDHGELWTPVVASNDVVLELDVPSGTTGSVEVELGQIGWGYRGFGTGGGDLVALSGSCNVDVACPEGAGWGGPIRSVAVISTGGSTFCTGFLVNDTSDDRRPFFMTANHCGIGSGSAPSLVTYWNYENATCRTPGSPASGGPGDGQLTQFNSGATFRASSSASDFTLVELDDPALPAAQVFYAGWTRASGDFASAVGIHHPNTDEKRISFENQPTATTSYLGTVSPGDGTHVRVIDWDLGTTEPGSSGSPLFDPAQRIIGQLHGGSAACGNNLSDYYGRFSVSWAGGGTSATRLSTWLDAAGTGLIAIDGIDDGPATCTDADGDGYFAEGGACGPGDCDDGNAAVNPGATEIPRNGIDDDCDAGTPAGCTPELASASAIGTKGSAAPARVPADLALLAGLLYAARSAVRRRLAHASH